MTGESSNSGGAAGTVHPDIMTQSAHTACAWRGADLAHDDIYLPLPAAAEAELDGHAARLRDHAGAIPALDPDDFPLPATAELMAEVRARLDQGVGFAVLDRLPVARWGEPATKAVSWLLNCALGPVVEQKFDGTRLYEVRDTGRTLGYGVRRSVTNLEQELHTDGGWLTETPARVSLVCLRPAHSGGLSRVASLVTAHDRLREEHPDLLARLYRPFWWDRQAEHGPEDPRCSRHPVFRWQGGTLTVRYYADYVEKGAGLMDEPLDETAVAALAAFRSIIEAPENRIEFRLEAGQIEYVNNHLIAHARTAFENGDAAGSGRHLLRLWGRRGGGIALEQPPAAGT